MNTPKRYLITAALPYANGPVHIGHLAGVYVPADIYARYLRLRGRDVKFVCGSDEHGVAITIKARQEEVSPKEVVDKYHNMIKQSFDQFGITFDIYSRTTSKVHYETASEFFKNLYDKGLFVEQTTEQFYDNEAGQFLADRYVSGTCPNCHNDGAYGDQCESCGSSLNATDLINPKSALTGTKPELRETRHWFMPLDRYEDFLRNWILEENKDWKSNVYGQCKSWLDNGLQPRSISRDLNWGVPIPLPDAEGKVLYVWFDAPIGYISATKELTTDWEKYWKDQETKLVHFIGKDNIVFHCVIFPSILQADGTYILPDNVPANEFMNLENDKISTSRNWAVWLHEYLDDFPGKQDVLRYVLTANMPETKDNDFTWKDFQDRNNNELVGILGNFVNRAMVLTNKYFDGKVPQSGSLNEEDQTVLADIKQYKAAIEDNLEHFKFREALKEMMNLARLGNKYLADNEPWKLIKHDEQRVKTILNISLQLTANLAILAEPFLPNTAVALKEFINQPDKKWEEAGSGQLLETGHELNKPSLLFAKVEDEEIQKQLDKLINARQKAEASDIEPAKEEISFDEFNKMDIRVGTVLEAEKVPKTKKLLKLTIHTGLDKRTVVSGIAEHYQPEEMIGKQVCILVNLAPRKIRGIESQGMILMAENGEGKLVSVVPDEKFQEGAVVR
ncbi:MAG: methionine--tRNA ligase [Bacteroidetes bacterium]|jgi:methionyl-tRNA synthetase|nr:methionine--tRNA ligase [Bacteroidota bacterium]